MRRKPGALTPTELAILDAALRLRNRGENEFYGYLIAKEIREARFYRITPSGAAAFANSSQVDRKSG